MTEQMVKTAEKMANRNLQMTFKKSNSKRSMIRSVRFHSGESETVEQTEEVVKEHQQAQVGSEKVESTTPKTDEPKSEIGKEEGTKVSAREAELLKEVMRRKESEKALKAELEPFKNVDPVKYAALLKEKDDRDRAALEEKGDYERVKKQIIEQHQVELASLKESSDREIQELKTALSTSNSTITDLTIGRSFGDSKYLRENITLTPAKARVVYGSHFEVQDGKVVAFDRPVGSAERSVLVGSDGEPLQFDSALERIVRSDPEFDQIARSKVKIGAHSVSEAVTGKEPHQANLTGRDRISAALKARPDMQLNKPAAK